jgi:hypothetical protein
MSLRLGSGRWCRRDSAGSPAFLETERSPFPNPNPPVFMINQTIMIERMEMGPKVNETSLSEAVHCTWEQRKRRRFWLKFVRAFVMAICVHRGIASRLAPYLVEENCGQLKDAEDHRI